MYQQDVINRAYDKIREKSLKGIVDITENDLLRGYRAFSINVNGRSSLPKNYQPAIISAPIIIPLVILLVIAVFAGPLFIFAYGLIIFLVIIGIGFQTTQCKNKFEILFKKELGSVSNQSQILSEEISNLKTLLESGVIDEDEFSAAKAKLLK
jgi:ABC-type multidrug transport system fused ATPase/permease subunit